MKILQQEIETIKSGDMDSVLLKGQVKPRVPKTLLAALVKQLPQISTCVVADDAGSAGSDNEGDEDGDEEDGEEEEEKNDSGDEDEEGNEGEGGEEEARSASSPVGTGRAGGRKPKRTASSGGGPPQPVRRHRSNESATSRGTGDEGGGDGAESGEGGGDDGGATSSADEEFGDIGLTEDGPCSTSRLLTLWKATNSNKLALIFRKPVNRAHAPGYDDVVKQPMDLHEVLQRVERKEVTTVAGLRRLLYLICDNAMVYNGKGSDYFDYAKEFKEFIAAQLDSAVGKGLNTMSEREQRRLRRRQQPGDEDSEDDDEGSSQPGTSASKLPHSPPVPVGRTGDG